MRFSKMKLTAKRVIDTQNSMILISKWRLGVLTSAIALLGSVSFPPAHALGLGKISVRSALGEALRAEIEIPEINAEEAVSLRVGAASPAAFTAAGLEYSPAITALQVSLQKRADGRLYLSLTSNRPVTEPFIDLILEASWASGRLVRDYTMLFDPPSLRQPDVATAAPSVSRPLTGSAVAPMPAPAARTPTEAAARPAQGTRPLQEARQTPVQRAATVKSNASESPKAATTNQQVTVKSGDTASKIAARTKPASISLDQMLVALLKSNPDAFIGGNINRLRSGKVLGIPSADDAGAVAPEEASRTIVAQAKDFNSFRQKLATGAPMTQVESANRAAAGKVQAKVEDRGPAAAAPDKLTLSKGALAGKAVQEEALAKEKQSKDAAARVAELSKNIGDLSKLAAAPGAAGAAAGTSQPASAAKGAGLSIDKPAPVALPTAPALTSPAPTSTAPVLPLAVSPPKLTPTVSAPALNTASAASTPSAAPTTSTTVSTTVSNTAASTSTSSSNTAAITSTAALPLPVAAPATATATATASMATGTSAIAAAVAASTPVLVKKPVVAAPPEPSFVDELTNNDMVLPGLGALLALLAGFGFYRYKKRQRATPVDSSFLESRLQPDSFFGASGGQRVDTNEGTAATGSSMVYSPSQLDAAGDVDPVAEADVYLAYGRDLQAEEILKEALRTHPTRVAIHAKLLEIYAKRRDLKGFEALAAEAFSLTGGSGADWDAICELGRGVDPINPLYQLGGQPQEPVDRAAEQAAARATAFGGDTIPVMMVSSLAASTPATEIDFDLDLDFSDDNLTLAESGAKPEPTIAMRAIPPSTVDYAKTDFADPEPYRPAAPPASVAPDNLMNFDLDLPAMPTVAITPAAKAAIQTRAAPAAVDSGIMEFDMSALSLDLQAPATESQSLPKTAAPTLAAPALLASGLVTPALVTPAFVLGDALETKFALAEEFRSLGDHDGARALANEVVLQAQGGLKTKAQAFLNALA